MPRNPNNDFIAILKNYFKTEWMKNGQQQFSKTIQEITEDVFGKDNDNANNKNKVWRYINILEKGGSIKVIKGAAKTSPSWFTFVSDNINIIENNLTIAEDHEENVTELLEAGNNVLQDFVDYTNAQAKEIMALKGMISIYKETLSNFKFWSTNPENNEQIFSVKKGYDARSVIERVQKEIEKELRDEKAGQE